MKKNLSRVFTTIGFSLIILGLIFSTFPSQSYAEDLELIGKEIGLIVEPENTRLFDLTNLNPGDTKVATLTIENKYSKPFNLYMRAERVETSPLEGEADLFNILYITVTLRGEKIYEGPIKNFAISSISLGSFNPGSKGELVAIVHLPGLETGNEYQGKSAEVKWIFIAECSMRPDGDNDDEDNDTPVIDEPEYDVKEDKQEEPVEQIEEPKEPEQSEEYVDEFEDQIVEVQEDETQTENPVRSKDKPKIPKTGELPTQIFYISGSIMIFLGIYINSKNKK